MIIKDLGIQDYNTVWNDMKCFTKERLSDTLDEIWLLEHYPVYTQGQGGKEEHILNPNTIPIVKTDRGGQVTYHGPGQLVVYFLVNIQKRNIGIRSFVCQLEQALITLLKQFGIEGLTRCGAPGVYVDEKKIASIGLRVKNGCTYHGIALNISMDLRPFHGINPCGYAQLEMTQMANFIPEITVERVKSQFKLDLMTLFGS